VQFQILKGESVELRVTDGTHLGLDEAGTGVWELPMEHGDLAAVFEQMLRECDVEPEPLAADLQRLTRELQEQGLVDVAPSEAACESA
jgi:hypothetical protein